jgi:hypothetical protein
MSHSFDTEQPQIPVKLDDYLTTMQAARELGMKHRTLLKRLLRAPSRIAHRRIGRMYFIPKTEVQRLKDGKR